MKKALKIIIIVLVIAFIAIQFYRPDTATPPVVAGQTLEATTNMPETVEKILVRSCKDCHSNETVYPWYSQIQPSASFLAGHIAEGRRQLNFSEWGTYENRRQRRKLGEICEQVESKEMPLPSYLWVHWGAKLSDEDRKVICDWTTQETTRIESAEAK